MASGALIYGLRCRGSSLDEKQRRLLGLSPLAPAKPGSTAKPDNQAHLTPVSAQKPARLLGPPQVH